VTAPAGQLARLRRRGFWLEYASMAWMTIEAAVAIAAGVLASSIALVGFGLDSVIEFFAAAIVIWQLRGEEGERETRAVRLIGVTFFVLAAYLVIEGARDLFSHARPGRPCPGSRWPPPPCWPCRCLPSRNCGPGGHWATGH
jgi:hypothetical protein